MTNIKRGKEAVGELYSDPLVIVLKLRYQLNKRELTQKDLSEMTGIRPNAISMLARGYVERLNLDHIERIAAALDITDINELIELVPQSQADKYEV